MSNVQGSDVQESSSQRVIVVLPIGGAWEPVWFSVEEIEELSGGGQWIEEEFRPVLEDCPPDSIVLLEVRSREGYEATAVARDEVVGLLEQRYGMAQMRLS